MRFLAACLLAVALSAFSLSPRAQTPQPPEIAARQYILIDLASNQVLAERDADAQAEPASLTRRRRPLGISRTLLVTRQ